jgi:hypothetical protein
MEVQSEAITELPHPWTVPRQQYSPVAPVPQTEALLPELLPEPLPLPELLPEPPELLPELLPEPPPLLLEVLYALVHAVPPSRAAVAASAGSRPRTRERLTMTRDDSRPESAAWLAPPCRK